jgi:hypothetical protein
MEMVSVNSWNLIEVVTAVLEQIAISFFGGVFLLEPLFLELQFSPEIVGVWSPNGSLGTSATVPAPDDYDDGEFGGMKIGRGNRSTRRKPAPAPLYPPQIPLDQTRVWTRAAAVGSRRLTAWAMPRAYKYRFGSLQFDPYWTFFTVHQSQMFLSCGALQREQSKHPAEHLPRSPY